MRKQNMKKTQWKSQMLSAFLSLGILLQASSVAASSDYSFHHNNNANATFENSVDSFSGQFRDQIPIIVIPGTAGSEMRNPENSVLQMVWINPLWHFQGHIEQLALDEHGLPVLSSIYPVPNGYGANNNYRTLLRALRSEFGNERVHFWGHDWRLDNAYNAERLSRFIDDLNAPQVHIVAHSMGGLIAARYIADGHGDRINTLITLGTPFLGTPRVPYIFATGNLVEVPILPGPRNGVRNVSSHMLSTYQMLPFESPYPYIGVGKRTGSLWWSSLKWEHIDDEQAFIRDLLPMRGVENSSVPSSVRAGFLERATQFIESTFIEGVHAVETVNSHVIIGDNIPTIHTTIFTHNGDFIENLEFTRGDGTVPVWSQNINGRVNTISFSYQHTALTNQPRVIDQIIRLIYGIQMHIDEDPIASDPFVVIRSTNATDVTVSRHDEILSSEADTLNMMTNFGTLHFIGPDEETKILALTADRVDDVLLIGTDVGTTDYSIRFYDHNLELQEERVFLDVPVSNDTVISTNTNRSRPTTLRLTSNRNRSFNLTLQPDYIYIPE